MRTWRGGLLLIVSMSVLGAWSARGQDSPPAWAYVVNPPDFKYPSGDGEPRHVPDSDRTYSVSQTRDRFSAPDWHPDDHPPMPDIVAHGRKPEVWACGFCHRADGPGGPENASLTGLPADYIRQQMADYKNGLRTTSVAGRVPPNRMISLAKELTDEEIEAGADYFAGLKQRANLKVIATDRVPKTVVAGWFLADAKTGETEPIGDRIIEVPEDLQQFESRDARSRFIVYVPIGSIERGKALAAGGNEKTAPCGTCHDPALKGVGSVPGIAGRSPSYVFRQLYDLKSGARAGAASNPMKPVVEKLTIGDMTALAAYLASLTP